MVELGFEDFEEDKKKDEQKTNKKDLVFQKLPDDVNKIIENKPTNFKEQEESIIKEFTKSQPIPLPDNSVQNNLSLILNPNLKDLELMIRGLQYVRRFNPITGREEIFLEKIPDHPLNEYGINTIMAELRLWCSPEIKLGRKNTQMYVNSVQHIGRSITRLIYKNLRNFGMITQVQQRHAKRFCNAIIEFVDSSYSRSIEGQENDSSRPTEYVVNANMNDNPEIMRTFNKQTKENLKN